MELVSAIPLLLLMLVAEATDDLPWKGLSNFTVDDSSTSMDQDTIAEAALLLLHAATVAPPAAPRHMSVRLRDTMEEAAPNVFGEAASGGAGMCSAPDAPVESSAGRGDRAGFFRMLVAESTDDLPWKGLPNFTVDDSSTSVDEDTIAEAALLLLHAATAAPPAAPRHMSVRLRDTMEEAAPNVYGEAASGGARMRSAPDAPVESSAERRDRAGFFRVVASEPMQIADLQCRVPPISPVDVSDTSMDLDTVAEEALLLLYTAATAAPPAAPRNPSLRLRDTVEEEARNDYHYETGEAVAGGAGMWPASDDAPGEGATEGRGRDGFSRVLAVEPRRSVDLQCRVPSNSPVDVSDISMDLDTIAEAALLALYTATERPPTAPRNTPARLRDTMEEEAPNEHHCEICAAADGGAGMYPASDYAPVENSTERRGSVGFFRIVDSEPMQDYPVDLSPTSRRLDTVAEEPLLRLPTATEEPPAAPRNTPVRLRDTIGEEAQNDRHYETDEAAAGGAGMCSTSDAPVESSAERQGRDGFSRIVDSEPMRSVDLQYRSPSNPPVDLDTVAEALLALHTATEIPPAAPRNTSASPPLDVSDNSMDLDAVAEAALLLAYTATAAPPAAPRNTSARLRDTVEVEPPNDYHYVTSEGASGATGMCSASDDAPVESLAGRMGRDGFFRVVDSEPMRSVDLQWRVPPNSTVDVSDTSMDLDAVAEEAVLLLYTATAAPPAAPRNTSARLDDAMEEEALNDYHYETDKAAAGGARIWPASDDAPGEGSTERRDRDGFSKIVDSEPRRSVDLQCRVPSKSPVDTSDTSTDPETAAAKALLALSTANAPPPAAPPNTSVRLRDTMGEEAPKDYHYETREAASGGAGLRPSPDDAPVESSAERRGSGGFFRIVPSETVPRVDLRWTVPPNFMVDGSAPCMELEPAAEAALLALYTANEAPPAAPRNTSVRLRDTVEEEATHHYDEERREAPSGRDWLCSASDNVPFESSAKRRGRRGAVLSEGTSAAIWSGTGGGANYDDSADSDGADSEDGDSDHNEDSDHGGDVGGGRRSVNWIRWLPLWCRELWPITSRDTLLRAFSEALADYSVGIDNYWEQTAEPVDTGEEHSPEEQPIHFVSTVIQQANRLLYFYRWMYKKLTVSRPDYNLVPQSLYHFLDALEQQAAWVESISNWSPSLRWTCFSRDLPVILRSFFWVMDKQQIWVQIFHRWAATHYDLSARPRRPPPSRLPLNETTPALNVSRLSARNQTSEDSDSAIEAVSHCVCTNRGATLTPSYEHVEDRSSERAARPNSRPVKLLLTQDNPRNQKLFPTCVLEYIARRQENRRLMTTQRSPTRDRKTIMSLGGRGGVSEEARALHRYGLDEYDGVEEVDPDESFYDDGQNVLQLQEWAIERVAEEEIWEEQVEDSGPQMVPDQGNSENCSLTPVWKELGPAFDPQFLVYVECDEADPVCEPPAKCAPVSSLVAVRMPRFAAIPDVPSASVSLWELADGSLQATMWVATSCECREPADKA